jgi:hypothetical protein
MACGPPKKKGGYKIPLTVCSGAVFFLLLFLAAAGSFLGSLEGVDLRVIDLDLDLDVAGKITDPIAPLFGRCRIGTAYLAD